MKLKELRKEKKLNQIDIAKILNVAISTYGGYEQETSEPNIETLCKLADYYHVSLDYLVGRQFGSDLGYLDELDRNLLEVSKQLNNLNKMQLIAYASGLLSAQK